MASSEREGAMPSVVIEIVTFRLASGTSVGEFKALGSPTP